MSQLEHVAAYAQPKGNNPNSAFGDLDVTVTIRRTLAGLFDLAILGVVLLSLLRTYGFVSHTWIIQVPLYHKLGFLPKYWVFTLMYMKPLGMILFIALAVSYFSVFEAALGWTPGKLLFGIRVVDFYGGSPSSGQALIRNVLRVLDAYPYVVPNLLGFVVLISNRRRQRGGDKAAGTLVVDSRSAAAVKTMKRLELKRKAAELALPEEVWT